MAGPQPIRAATRRVAGRSGPVDLEVVEGTDAEADADVLLVRIPLDFYRMLQETDVEDGRIKDIPVRWRSASRQVLQALLGRGYRIVDFRRAEPGHAGNHYVLARSGPPNR